MFEPRDIEVTTFRPSSHGSNTWLPANGVTVMHIPTSIGVTVDSERSQHANKEKALTLLEDLLRLKFPYLCTETPLPRDWDGRWASTPLPTPFIANKVQMIKDVRDQAGCGLKEAKEAVDKYGNVEEAVRSLKKADYSCMYGDMCRCGGDTQGVRQGCSSYTGEQL